MWLFGQGGQENTTLYRICNGQALQQGSSWAFVTLRVFVAAYIGLLSAALKHIELFYTTGNKVHVVFWRTCCGQVVQQGWRGVVFAVWGLHIVDDDARLRIASIDSLFWYMCRCGYLFRGPTGR
jgi:hypothetical protein